MTSRHQAAIISGVNPPRHTIKGRPQLSVNIHLGNKASPAKHGCGSWHGKVDAQPGGGVFLCHQASITSSPAQQVLTTHT
jgi:hypothetical protein